MSATEHYIRYAELAGVWANMGPYGSFERWACEKFDQLEKENSELRARVVSLYPRAAEDSPLQRAFEVEFGIRPIEVSPIEVQVLAREVSPAPLVGASLTDALQLARERDERDRG